MVSLRRTGAADINFRHEAVGGEDYFVGQFSINRSAKEQGVTVGIEIPLRHYGFLHLLVAMTNASYSCTACSIENFPATVQVKVVSPRAHDHDGRFVQGSVNEVPTLNATCAFFDALSWVDWHKSLHINCRRGHVADYEKLLGDP